MCKIRSCEKRAFLKKRHNIYKEGPYDIPKPHGFEGGNSLGR